MTWLRADLVLHRKQAASANPTERKTASDRLAHWLQDSDLDALRAKQAGQVSEAD